MTLFQIIIEVAPIAIAFFVMCAGLMFGLVVGDEWGTVRIGTTACVCAALFLAYHDKEGWGWFLFVALLIAGSGA